MGIYVCLPMHIYIHIYAYVCTYVCVCFYKYMHFLKTIFAHCICLKALKLTHCLGACRLFLSEGNSKLRRPVSGLFRPRCIILDTPVLRLLPITLILSVLTGPSASHFPCTALGRISSKLLQIFWTYEGYTRVNTMNSTNIVEYSNNGKTPIYCH